MNVIAKFAHFAAWFALSFAAPAQTFPERPINLVVAYSAGGSTDVVMRVLADIAAKHLGQRVKDCVSDHVRRVVLFRIVAVFVRATPADERAFLDGSDNDGIGVDADG